MKLFGFEVTKASASPQPIQDRSGWRTIFEAFPGAWQRNVTVNQEAVLAYSAVFSCLTLISSDIAKLRVKLVKQEKGIWSEFSSPAYSPVLRKPNRFQNRIQFYESWVLSKLARGNTYVLKEKDRRGVVVGLYVLDPTRVRPLVTDGGDVYYELQTDNLSGLSDATTTVPASEIIHDRFNCLFHPLVGISPIYASGLAATQGLHIQNNSAAFFGNASKPGGLLVAPGKIDPENAARLKEYWESNFTGENVGKLAVLGDGLKYEALTVDPKDAQMIEQLKWTAEVVCSTFHVPPYKIGVGVMPSYNNVQALNVEYYSQCLQVLIEAIELCLDEGLGTGDTMGTEFDLENLLRMDAVTHMEVLDKSKGKLTVNEQRAKLDLPPVEGGDTVYLQEQDHSLSWLARRDAQPIEVAAPAPVPEPVNDNDAELQATRALLAMTKGLANV